MIDVEKIKQAIDMLLHKDFVITIEDGTVIEFNFQLYNFHHLLGFQKLKDQPSIAKSKHPDEVVKRFMNGKISLGSLQKSSSFHLIEARMEYFPLIAEMLITDKCKIIVDFDATLVKSTIVKSKYFLYKTDDHVTYKLFGLAPLKKSKFYPETFLVEPSKYYVSEQIQLDCTIRHTEHHHKRK